MGAKHIVVQGATVKCKFSIAPETDLLKVKSQGKHFANDKESSNKLIATNKEIGQTLEKNTFGKCKLQPSGNNYLPCHVVITQWRDFYENITLSNHGKILTEDSKATCPIGGSDCISIVNHGQKADSSKEQSRNSDDTLNPVADNKKYKEEDEQDNQTFAE
jgi:Domain of unknown function (DUF4280)